MMSNTAVQCTMFCTPLVSWTNSVLYRNAADVDEQSKREIKDILLQYDRTLLVADPRRCEPKKYDCACSKLPPVCSILSVNMGTNVITLHCTDVALGLQQHACVISAGSAARVRGRGSRSHTVRLVILLLEGSAWGQLYLCGVHGAA